MIESSSFGENGCFGGELYGIIPWWAPGPPRISLFPSSTPNPPWISRHCQPLLKRDMCWIQPSLLMIWKEADFQSLTVWLVLVLGWQVLLKHKNLKKKLPSQSNLQWSVRNSAGQNLAGRPLCKCICWAPGKVLKGRSCLTSLVPKCYVRIIQPACTMV